jgi:hypothetical protein
MLFSPVELSRGNSLTTLNAFSMIISSKQILCLFVCSKDEFGSHEMIKLI